MSLFCRAASNQLSIKRCAPVNPAVSWPQVTSHTGSLMVQPGFWVSHKVPFWSFLLPPFACSAFGLKVLSVPRKAELTGASVYPKTGLLSVLL